jgi:hypothetical protein
MPICVIFGVAPLITADAGLLHTTRIFELREFKPFASEKKVVVQKMTNLLPVKSRSLANRVSVTDCMKGCKTSL